MRALHFALERYLQSRIPGSRLEKSRPPQAPEIELYLINADYPRDGLDPEQVQALMDNPPYWAFCWASGQALARHILASPQKMAGKTLVDFGAGSGVVGIAAKLAGAARVILCDCDPIALDACRLNAVQCGVEVEYSASLDEAMAQVDGGIVTVADVFYDRENLPLLSLLQTHFEQVLIADSRLKGQPLPGMTLVGTVTSHTVPDLDESVEFNRVALYETKTCNHLKVLPA